MFQLWFVVSDFQCFCPPCSNRLAFAFGKRQPRGGVLSPINTLNIGSNKRNVTNLLD